MCTLPHFSRTLSLLVWFQLWLQLRPQRQLCRHPAAAQPTSRAPAPRKPRHVSNSRRRIHSLGRHDVRHRSLILRCCRLLWRICCSCIDLGTQRKFRR